MLRFKAIDVDGNKVEGCGVLHVGEGYYILYLEEGYCSDINEDEMGAALYVYVKKETIEMIVE